MSGIKIQKEKSFFEGETITTHPAFGVIGLSRVSSAPSVNLFGSAVKHGHYFELTIKTARRNSSGTSEERHRGEKELIRVAFSGVQLGELLTSANVGDGAPCTLIRVGGESMPVIPDIDNFKVESQKQYTEQLNRTFEKSKAIIKKAEEMVRNGLPKKADKEEFLSLINMLGNDINSGLGFAGACFDEKVERVVSQAKGEVEAFVDHKIRSAGLVALANDPIVQIEI